VKRPALWIASSIGVVVALFIGVLATRDAAANRVAPSPLVGRRGPEIIGPGLDGAEFRLSSLQGKFVLVNFFATWCVPCVKEHPEMVRFAQGHASVGDAAIVSVVFDDERADVRRFFAQRGGDWPVVENSAAKVEWGVRGVPESFLVAPDGTVLTRIVGGVTASGLEQLLAQAKRGGR
jgi:cytochrome c biogenesis protein CcmG/thiol:disulfide interchange protein DsbE